MPRVTIQKRLMAVLISELLISNFIRTQVEMSREVLLSVTFSSVCKNRTTRFSATYLTISINESTDISRLKYLLKRKRTM